ncbi:uncharacterized protein [Branchiostoma lanceolatum]|uniref:uncharacterized protein isoform X2 n=1 Tax=Branchiostoma lanceolatum TaxID=7740 RepID=UPI003452F548
MPTSDYQYEEGTFDVTPEIKRDFDENGYVIIRGVLSKQEISNLRQALELEEGVKKHSYEIPDGSGKSIRLCIWRHPGNDVTAMIARMEKTAGFMGKFLGGEVYHHHSKLIQKEPYTGGLFSWHQDYGYTQSLLHTGIKMAASSQTWHPSISPWIKQTGRMGVCRFSQGRTSWAVLTTRLRAGSRAQTWSGSTTSGSCSTWFTWSWMKVTPATFTATCCTAAVRTTPLGVAGPSSPPSTAPVTTPYPRSPTPGLCTHPYRWCRMTRC